MSTLEVDARRIARPAPAGAHPEHEDAQSISRRELDADHEIHLLCEAWGAWCRTRRFYVRTSLPPPALARLITRTRTGGAGGPDAPAGAELAAFHLAVIGQPIEALDRQVFELHYRWRVRNVKAASRELGIGRQHWYTLLRAFRRRVYSAYREIVSSRADTSC